MWRLAQLNRLEDAARAHRTLTESGRVTKELLEPNPTEFKLGDFIITDRNPLYQP